MKPQPMIRPWHPDRADPTAGQTERLHRVFDRLSPADVIAVAALHGLADPDDPVALNAAEMALQRRW